MIGARHTAGGVAPTLLVRTCALILHAGQVCLIRRERPDGNQYSLPGGILHPDETVPAALARELKEELDLNVAALRDQPDLRWVQDQLTTRPGRPDLFRRLHLVHLLHLPGHARVTVAAAEQHAEDRAPVVWVDLTQAARLHLYPAMADVLRALASHPVLPVPVLLPPMTNRTYSWR